eukprot:1783731-Pyramimonas_sp.AAC.1
MAIPSPAFARRVDRGGACHWFQGLLVGGIFVHVPFLACGGESEPGERISTFRATEELMLRCGGAFVEMVLLGK